jgi:hypothetical protein
MIDTCDSKVIFFYSQVRPILRKHVEETDIGIVYFSGNPRSSNDRYNLASVADPDSTGEKQIHFARSPNGKLARIFQEERPLLRKK